MSVVVLNYVFITPTNIIINYICSAYEWGHYPEESTSGELLGSSRYAWPGTLCRTHALHGIIVRMCLQVLNSGCHDMTTLILTHCHSQGSAKYPAENHYDQFITSKGGYCNAFTDGEVTQYTFEVPMAHCFSCLDIFAQCFQAPLFKK